MSVCVGVIRPVCAGHALVDVVVEALHRDTKIELKRFEAETQDVTQYWV